MIMILLEPLDAEGYVLRIELAQTLEPVGRGVRTLQSSVVALSRVVLERVSSHHYLVDERPSGIMTTVPYASTKAPDIRPLGAPLTGLNRGLDPDPKLDGGNKLSILLP